MIFVASPMKLRPCNARALLPRPKPVAPGPRAQSQDPAYKKFVHGPCSRPPGRLDSIRVPAYKKIARTSLQVILQKCRTLTVISDQGETPCSLSKNGRVPAREVSYKCSEARMLKASSLRNGPWPAFLPTHERVPDPSSNNFRESLPTAQEHAWNGQAYTYE